VTVSESQVSSVVDLRTITPSHSEAQSFDAFIAFAHLATVVRH